jgi:hypothetical protein
MWLISVLCLVLVATLCAWGVFTDRYNDNLPQMIGMGAMFFGALSIAWRIWRVEFVPMDALFVHVGLALYAVGTAWKVYRKPHAYAMSDKERAQREARMSKAQHTAARR